MTRSEPTAVIVAGGDPIPVDGLPPLPDHSYVIAADSGLHAAQALGLSVDLVIGDFDSASTEAVSTAEHAGASLERHPADKDATDMELALDAAVTRGLSPTVILGGASFDRLDHFMANALLLADPRYRSLRPQWWVKGAQVTPVHDEMEITGAVGDLLTLLPIGGTAHGVTSNGLRWELTHEDLPAGSTRGVSNEMTCPVATIRLTSGTLLAIHTRST